VATIVSPSTSLYLINANSELCARLFHVSYLFVSAQELDYIDGLLSIVFYNIFGSGFGHRGSASTKGSAVLRHVDKEYGPKGTDQGVWEHEYGAQRNTECGIYPWGVRLERRP
jgi:hypothetical protein